MAVKTLEIKMVGDSANLEQSLEKVNTVLGRTTLLTRNLQVSLNSLDPSKFNISLKASAEEAKRLQKVLDEINKVVPTQPNLETKSANTSYSVRADGLKAQAEAFRQASLQEVNALKNRLELEQAIRLNGISSTKVMETKAAQAEITIREKLAADLLAIEENIKNSRASRSISTGRFASADTAKADLIANAEQSINLNRQVLKNSVDTEIEKNRIFSASLKEQEAQTRSSIAIRNAEEIHGIKSIQAERLKAAEQIRQLEQARQKTITHITSNVASGGISQAQGIIQATAANALYKDAVNGVNKSLNEHSAALEATAKVQRNIIIRAAEFIGIYKVLNYTLSTISATIRAIPNIGIELDSTRASLLATTGSSAGAESVLKSLRTEAERTGIQITALRESFRGFQASTSLAGATLTSTWSMFTNLNTVITGLHLSTDKANGIFLAMAQIFNKGKVQSEELVKQLGNLLPGAFASMAASMGISTIELSRQMKQGLVYAQDVMEGFTEYMRDRFASAFAVAAQGVNANIGRMQNSFTTLAEIIYKEIEPSLLATIKGITSVVDGAIKLADNFDSLKAAAKLLAEVGFAALTLSIGRYIAAISLAGKGTLGFGATVGSTIAAMKFAELGSIALTGTLTLLRGVFLTLLPIAVVTGIIAGGQKLYDMFIGQSNAAEAANEKLREYLRLKAELGRTPEAVNKINIAVANDATVAALKENIKAEEERLNDLRGSLTVNKRKKLEEVSTNIDAWRKELAARSKVVRDDLVNQEIDEERQRSETLAIKLEDINESLVEKITRNAEDAIGAGKRAIEQFKKDHKTDLANLESESKAIARVIEKSGRITDTNLSELASISASKQKIMDAANAAGIKAQEEYHSKQASIEIEQAKREAALSKGIIEGDLAQQTILYNQGLLGIEDYYAKRTAAREKEIESQMRFNEREKEIARSKGDTQKVKELETQFTTYLEVDVSNAADADVAAKTAALKEYTQIINEMNATILEGKGNVAEAVALRNKIKFSDEAHRLASNNATKAEKEQLEIIHKRINAMAVIAEYDKKRNFELAGLQAEEISINIARENGLLNQQQAAERLTTIKYKILELDRANISVLEEQVKLNQGNVDLTEKLIAARVQLAQDSATTTAQQILQQGQPDFLTQYNQEQSKLQQERVLEQSTLDNSTNTGTPYKDPGEMALEAQKARLEKQTALDDKYRNAGIKSNFAYYGGIAGVAATTFEGITSSMIKMYGAQSKQAKAAFLAYKAFAIAQTVMTTAQAVMAQLANPTPYVGIALAALAAAMGAVQIAKIVAEPMPQAHAGLDYVPENNQTYVLSKGERVLAPQQNKDLTKALQEGTLGSQPQNQAPQTNIRIINAVDPELFNEWAASPAGEQVIMNTVRRNEHV